MTDREHEVPNGRPLSDSVAADEVDRLRQTCPVKPEHKAIFPAPPWRWQPAAAAWVWAVLRAAGGEMHAGDITERLAQLKGLSHRQANGLRNRGFTVLEAFELIEIERLPAGGQGLAATAYGRVQIVRDEIH